MQLGNKSGTKVKNPVDRNETAPKKRDSGEVARAIKMMELAINAAREWGEGREGERRMKIKRGTNNGCPPGSNRLSASASVFSNCHRQTRGSEDDKRSSWSWYVSQIE